MTEQIDLNWCSKCGGTLKPEIPVDGMGVNHQGEHVRCGRCRVTNWASYHRHRVEPGARP